MKVEWNYPIGCIPFSQLDRFALYDNTLALRYLCVYFRCNQLEYCHFQLRVWCVAGFGSVLNANSGCTEKYLFPKILSPGSWRSRILSELMHSRRSFQVQFPNQVQKLERQNARNFPYPLVQTPQTCTFFAFVVPLPKVKGRCRLKFDRNVWQQKANICSLMNMMQLWLKKISFL